MFKRVFLILFAWFAISVTVLLLGWNTWLDQRLKSTFIDIPADLIMTDSQGQLWAATWDLNGNTLRLYENGNLLRTFTTQDMRSVPKDFTLDSKGQLWGISVSDIYVFDGSNWKFVTKTPQSFTMPENFVVDTERRIWADWPGQELHLYENGTWKTFTPKNSPLPGWVDVISVGVQGQVLVGTDTGIVITDGENWNLLPQIPAEWIGDALFDLNGNVWVGGSNGLYFLDGTQWIEYNLINSGLYEYAVLDLSVDSNNRIWAHSGGTTISVFDGTSWQYVRSRTLKSTFNQVVVAPNGDIYLRGSYEGTQIIDADTHLLNKFDLVFKEFLFTGSVAYIIFLLILIWLMIFLDAWGIGFGVFFGGGTFILFDAIGVVLTGLPFGYLNPGLILTLGGAIGGIIGYYLRKRGKIYADLIGGAIGCGIGIVISCLLFISLVLWVINS